METPSGTSPRTPDETKKSGQRVDRRARTREIIRWNPAKTELLTLGLIYALKQKKIPIPWDEAAALVEDRCTGGAAEQHIAKIRKRRIAEGEPVPPLVGRHGPVSQKSRPRKAQVSSTTPETPRMLRSRNTTKIKKELLSSGSSSCDPKDTADSDAEYKLPGSHSWGSVNKRGRAKKSSYSHMSDDELSSPESPLKKKKLSRNTYGKGRIYVASDTEIDSEDEKHAPSSSARKTVAGYFQLISRRGSDSATSVKSETDENDGVSCTERRMVTLQIRPRLLAQLPKDSVHDGTPSQSIGHTYAPRNAEYSSLRNSKFDDADAPGYEPGTRHSTLPYDYIPRHSYHEDGLDYVPQIDVGTINFHQVPQLNLQTNTYAYPPLGSHEGLQDSYASYPHPGGVTQQLQESPYFTDHLVNYTYPPERHLYHPGEHSQSFSSNAESDYGSAIHASHPMVTYVAIGNRSSTMEQSLGYYNSFGNGLGDNNHGLSG